MNKKGQTMALTIMSAILIFIVGLMFLNFIMPEVSTARANLQCSSADTITDATKLLCLAIDGTVPYWILMVFSIGIGAITARLL